MFTMCIITKIMDNIELIITIMKRKEKDVYPNNICHDYHTQLLIFFRCLNFVTELNELNFKYIKS